MGVKDDIRQFIVDNFVYGEEDNLLDNTSFLDSGIIDSTGILEVISFIEEKWNINVKDEEIIPENFDSISKLFQYIGRKLEEI